MRLKSSNGIHTDIPLLILASLVLLALPSRNADADDLLGPYIGGAVGQSESRANINSFNCRSSFINCSSGIPSVSFARQTTGWEAFAGIRPVPFLGAEAEYIDFGSSGTTNVFININPGIAGSGTTHPTATALLLPRGIPLCYRSAEGSRSRLSPTGTRTAEPVPKAPLGPRMTRQHGTSANAAPQAR